MSRPRPGPTADREAVYGRNPVRELIAAARRPVHEVRALPQVAGEPWLAGVRRARGHPRRLGRWARSGEHQGVAALTDPYPYAEPGDLLHRQGPLVCLDGAQDPRNVGAVAPDAEAPGPPAWRSPAAAARA